VNGLEVSTPAKVAPTPDSRGWPHVLNGISVDLVQGNPPATTSLELRALYQGLCAQPDSCASVTGITLQIPFELNAEPAGPFPVLRISQNGKPAGGVMLRAVKDNVHVMNTCDDSQIYISAAYSVPQDVCTPVVMVQGKLNSLYNLAHGGDELAMWLYGLGAKTEQAPACCNTPDQLSKPTQPFELNFDFRPNAPASPAVAGFGLTASPLFAAYAGAGTYQVNFSVPPVPAGVPACDGQKIKSNLTITISGSNSFDAAQVCVAP
jgi:hypothetical protein